MTKNVGARDAHVRIIVAVVFVVTALLIVDNPYLRIVLASLGAIMAGTAYLRTCWLYTLMGKNTCNPGGEEVPTSTQKPGEKLAEASEEKSL